jgi:hypothetical protein
MSAFILSEYQFRVLSSWFTMWDNQWKEYGFWGAPPKFLQKYRNNCSNTPSDQECLEQLFSLNAKAFKERYGEEVVCAYTFKRVAGLPLIEIMKTLMCFHYQCSEGVVIDSEEYKQLQDHINGLACTLVMNSPEFRDSKGW